MTRVTFRDALGRNTARVSCRPAQSVRNSPASRRCQRGLTLVEAMIGMTLALLVLGVAVTVFSGTSRGRADLERSQRLAEGTKYALDVLAEDVRHAGFYDALALVGVAWQQPSPCNTEPGQLGVSSAPFAMPLAVRGYKPDEITPACLAYRRPNTAAVTVRRLAVETTPRANAKDALYLQVSKCNKDLPQWKHGADPAEFTMRNIDCATPADIRRLVVRTYYVASCSECGRDTIPTLKRVDLENGAIVETALVEGVEDLRIEYGFDTDNDGNADLFRDGLSGVAGAADDTWTNVVALRLHVLGRTTQHEPGLVAPPLQYDFGEAGLRRDSGGDDHKRRLLSALVRMPNVAGPRERP